MHSLKQFRAYLVGSSLIAVTSLVLASAGCAGVKEKSMTGTGGAGGGIGRPPISGLSSLTVSPSSDYLTLTAGPSGVVGADKQFTATGVVNGATMDVSNRVTWSINLTGASVTDGLVHATAPGIFTVTARSGTHEASGQL